MIDIESPMINGTTDKEKLEQMIDYIGRLYTAIDLKLENITESDLSQSLREKIGVGHEALNNDSLIGHELRLQTIERKLGMR